MLDNGLIDEVKELLPHEHLNSLNTIGYKEIFKHFNGELNFQETIELIKTNSRRFAKRQLSWLKNNGNHYWLESTESNKNNIEKLSGNLFLANSNIEIASDIWPSSSKERAYDS